jgi:hypothetical protein
VSTGAANPLLHAIETLAKAGADFVVVGVGGINFYARDASEVVVTADVDLLLPARARSLRAALVALADAGFSFEAGGEPFLDVDNEEVLSNVASHGGSIAALGPNATRIDLMLSMTGFGFDELASDAARFRVGDVEIRVGRLEKLLRSKELSDRPKDREFIRLYGPRLAGRLRGEE